MKRNLLIKGFVLPLALGLVFGVAFFFFVSSSLTNYAEKAVGEIAYFDSDENAKNNETVGSMTFGESALDIRLDCDYSYMINSACLRHGSLPDKSAVGYYYVLEKDADGIKFQPINMSYDGRNYAYKYVASLEFENESELFSASLPISRGAVVYYQNTADYGIKDGYTALVFEEAE